jgi:hypothetical protein
VVLGRLEIGSALGWEGRAGKCRQKVGTGFGDRMIFFDDGQMGIGRRRPLGASAAGLWQWNGVASWVGGRCGRERSMDPF